MQGREEDGHGQAVAVISQQELAVRHVNVKMHNFNLWNDPVTRGGGMGLHWALPEDGRSCLLCFQIEGGIGSASHSDQWIPLSSPHVF